MSDQAAPRTDTTPPVAARAKSPGKMHELYDRVHNGFDSDDSDDERPARRPPARGVGVWPWSDGVIPRSKVRMACFAVLALSMFAAGALCIMSVWNATPIEVAWKAIASLGIVAALAAGFTVLNEVFGPKKGETAG